MELSRRNFLGGVAATTAFAAAPGCATFCKSCRPGKIALQLYSLNKWIPATLILYGKGRATLKSRIIGRQETKTLC